MFDRDNSPDELEGFYQRDKRIKIWETSFINERFGPILFSFDKKTIFNFWEDYPDKLTPEQIELFNKWDPTIAAFKNFGKPY